MRCARRDTCRGEYRGLRNSGRQHGLDKWRRCLCVPKTGEEKERFRMLESWPVVYPDSQITLPVHEPQPRHRPVDSSGGMNSPNQKGKEITSATSSPVCDLQPWGEAWCFHVSSNDPRQPYQPQRQREAKNRPKYHSHLAADWAVDGRAPPFTSSISGSEPNLLSHFKLSPRSKPTKNRNTLLASPQIVPHGAANPLITRSPMHHLQNPHECPQGNNQRQAGKFAILTPHENILIGAAYNPHFRAPPSPRPFEPPPKVKQNELLTHPDSLPQLPTDCAHPHSIPPDLPPSPRTFPAFSDSSNTDKTL
jgi:hypothetical protein